MEEETFSFGIQFFSKNTISISFQAEQKSDIPASILNIEKAEIHLGYKPCTEFRDGLQKMLMKYAREDFTINEKFNLI